MKELVYGAIISIIFGLILAMVANTSDLKADITENVVSVRANKQLVKKAISKLNSEIQSIKDTNIEPSITIVLENVTSAGDTEYMTKNIYTYASNIPTLYDAEYQTRMDLQTYDKDSYYEEEALDVPGLVVNRSKDKFTLYMSEIARNKLFGHKSVEGKITLHNGTFTKVNEHHLYPLETFTPDTRKRVENDIIEMNENTISFKFTVSGEADAVTAYYKKNSLSKAKSEAERLTERMLDDINSIKEKVLWDDEKTMNCAGYKKNSTINNRIITNIKNYCEAYKAICKEKIEEISTLFEELIYNDSLLIASSKNEATKLLVNKARKISTHDPQTANEMLKKSWLEEFGYKCEQQKSGYLKGYTSP